ncbi:MnhB domain-containing protein [Fusibacter bizertensis]|jgi:Domain related to MnhB subunit of Na+/H+ antiporter.|uniref:MnhB domain-containing protein n=1 Tax=Fusibacter bizertensis TaxID=1488331 RepID=A0ABT6NBF8_9FIRM|nr:MnhB domain-containing protein [Fusibacter bizertensis]MDH8677758.1 MnhB domain-containing protein [Fusibacter bizertensis]
MNDHSQLLNRTMGIIYPFVILFGIYIVLNGHISPGGGFQGGAVLSSVFIAKYLSQPIMFLDLYRIQTIEKYALLSLLILATLFITLNVYQLFVHSLVYYMVLANIIIGLKVACGMTIIFYRFAFYESR